MTSDQHHDPDDLLRILDAPEDFEEPLARFLESARSELTTPPHDFARTRHLAAIHGAARERRKQPVAWLARVRTVLGLTGVKIGLAATAAAAAAGGGAAATGSLPAPAQEVVADVAEQVGIDLPRPTEVAPPFTETPDDDPPGLQRAEEDMPPGLDRARDAMERAAERSGESHRGRIGPLEEVGPPDHANAADEADAAGDANAPDEPGPPEQANAPDEPGPPEQADADEDVDALDEVGPPDEAGAEDISPAERAASAARNAVGRR